METTLQEIESQLKSVVENAPFPIGVYTGRDMKVVLANKAMIKTLGKGQHIIGKSYFDILPELHGSGIYEKLLEVFDTGEAYEIKNSRVDLLIDGMPTVHYFNYAFTPLRDSNGNMYGVMNTGADVTDLNMARQHTLEAEEKLKLAVNSAELGTYEINMFNDEVSISGNFRRIWDIGDDVITKELILSRLHPEDLHIRETAFKNMGADGRVSYDIRIRHRDGTIRWLRINGTLIKNNADEPAVIVGIAQDITLQKESEEHLSVLVKQRTEELHRSNEDLLHFARTVSHDLKEPVRKVKIFNGMLKREVLSGIGHEYNQKVATAADRMALLIDGILNYSTISSAGFPVEKVNLKEIIKAIKMDLELVIQEKKAILIEDELPDIEGAPILIHQLFYNLINNALKFSRADAPPRVIISCSIINNIQVPLVEIIINDNGIGLDPNYQDKVFMAFERLHKKNEYEGNGLGLALCKKIVERHRGTIRATGIIGQGSDFIMMLPLKQSTANI